MARPMPYLSLGRSPDYAHFASFRHDSGLLQRICWDFVRALVLRWFFRTALPLTLCASALIRPTRGVTRQRIFAYGYIRTGQDSWIHVRYQKSYLLTRNASLTKCGSDPWLLDLLAAPVHFAFVPKTWRIWHICDCYAGFFYLSSCTYEERIQAKNANGCECHEILDSHRRPIVAKPQISSIRLVVLGCVALYESQKWSCKPWR